MAGGIAARFFAVSPVIYATAVAGDRSFQVNKNEVLENRRPSTVFDKSFALFTGKNMDSGTHMQGALH